MISARRFKFSRAAVLLMTLTFTSGCGTAGYYPVTGKVLDMSGQPIEGLEGCQISFSAIGGLTESIGEIRKDGSFEMMTERAGDGMPPGEYQVLINRRHIDPEHMTPQAIASKYEKFETSGMQVKVEPKRNFFEFKVERTKGK